MLLQIVEIALNLPNWYKQIKIEGNVKVLTLATVFLGFAMLPNHLRPILAKCTRASLCTTNRPCHLCYSFLYIYEHLLASFFGTNNRLQAISITFCSLSVTSPTSQNSKTCFKSTILLLQLTATNEIS